MRIYVGCTPGDLAQFWLRRQMVPGVSAAHAVTGALRQQAVDADEEELEYTALTAAARSSLQLLRAPGSGTGASGARRVVVAADVPESSIRPAPESGPSAVLVSAPVHLSDVASVHVDDPKVAALVAGAGAAGDPLAEHELLWYATQEIPDLIADA